MLLHSFGGALVYHLKRCPTHAEAARRVWPSGVQTMLRRLSGVRCAKRKSASELRVIRTSYPHAASPNR
jgi:hypothetical protein